jgi:hypothetical protein
MKHRHGGWHEHDHDSDAAEHWHVTGGSDIAYYPGPHDDCIATTPHYHDRPYKRGDWSAEPDPPHVILEGGYCTGCGGGHLSPEDETPPNRAQEDDGPRPAGP